MLHHLLHNTSRESARSAPTAPAPRAQRAPAALSPVPWSSSISCASPPSLASRTCVSRQCAAAPASTPRDLAMCTMLASRRQKAGILTRATACGAGSASPRAAAPLSTVTAPPTPVRIERQLRVASCASTSHACSECRMQSAWRSQWLCMCDHEERVLHERGAAVSGSVGRHIARRLDAVRPHVKVRAVDHVTGSG